MAQTSVAQFATQLKMPAGALLDQLQRAGVTKSEADDLLSEQDKSRLLEYLRRSHGSGDAKTKITLTRKETSEIRSHDSHGKSHMVQVEVRKKRVLVKRDPLDARRVAASQSPPALAAAASGEEMVEAALVEPVITAPVEEVAVPPVEALAAAEIAQAEVTAEPESEAAAEVVAEVLAEKSIAEAKVESVVEAQADAEAELEGELEVEIDASAEAAVEEKSKAKGKSKAKKDLPVEPKAGGRKVVTRASIIGEEQQKLRAEEERRNAELRALQEAEFKNKQQRVVDLARAKQDAEAKAVAAKAAGVAKQVAAQTASERPAEDKTLHKPPAKAATTDKKAAEKKAPEKKVADKKGQWKSEGANKRPGLKTRGATGGMGWRDNKHGKRPGRGASDEDEQHSFQLPVEPVIHQAVSYTHLTLPTSDLV